MRKFPLFIFLFTLLPMSQIFALHNIFDAEIAGTAIFLYTMIGFTAIIVLFIALKHLEKKISREEELKEIHQKIKLEQSHYQMVELNRQKLEALRREFNGKLKEISQIIRDGDEDYAKATIYTLKEKIDETKENPYCHIPVINAVLTAKVKEATAMGIDLKMDLNLPQNFAVRSMHMCSILSNLIDNALAACKNISSKVLADFPGNQHPTVQLSTLVQGDYLFIKVVNPAIMAAESTPRRGYGKKILSELAAAYGGSYQTEFKNGLFIAVISVLAVDDGQDGCRVIGL